RVYAITEQDSKASKSIVEGILHVSKRNAKVLFDPGSNLSFVSQYFACHLDILPRPLDYMLYVTTAVGDSLATNLVYPSCLISIGEHELLADLILLEIQGFDIILGMDWLSSHHASIDCYKKLITFCIPDQPIFFFEGIRHDLPPCLISALQVYRLMQKGCFCYMVCVKEHSNQETHLDEIVVVKEFPDVFPDDLPGLPLDREGEFAIDLVP
ncbi:unnamed protein product, partial [Musa textilis]